MVAFVVSVNKVTAHMVCSTVEPCSDTKTQPPIVMFKPHRITPSAALRTALFAALIASLQLESKAVDTNLLNGIVAYYPLDSANGPGGTSPDYVSGYNLTLQNLSAADLKTGYTNYDPVVSMNSHYGVNDKTFKFDST